MVVQKMMPYSFYMFLYPVHPGEHLVIRYLEPKIATEHFLVDELLI